MVDRRFQGNEQSGKEISGAGTCVAFAHLYVYGYFGNIEVGRLLHWVFGELDR